MILADSSAWIEYYRPDGDRQVQSAIAAEVRTDNVATMGIVQTEIVAFAMDEDEFSRLQKDFGAFHWRECTGQTYEVASNIGFELRRSGITMPATDLIIAATAIHFDDHLFHLDQHFEQIADIRPLTQTRFTRRQTS